MNPRFANGILEQIADKIRYMVTYSVNNADNITSLEVTYSLPASEAPKLMSNNPEATTQKYLPSSQSRRRNQHIYWSPFDYAVNVFVDGFITTAAINVTQFVLEKMEWSDDNIRHACSFVSNAMAAIVMTDTSAETILANMLCDHICYKLGLDQTTTNYARLTTTAVTTAFNTPRLLMPFGTAKAVLFSIGWNIVGAYTANEMSPTARNVFDRFRLFYQQNRNRRDILQPVEPEQRVENRLNNRPR